MSASDSKPKAEKKATAKAGSSKGFTKQERDAITERAQELKAEGRRSGRASRADGEQEVLEKIEAMPEPDRTLGKRLHRIIKASAPDLVPRLWYGMPAYAKDGKVLCFFQGASKFKTRYATLGFSDVAVLDEGSLWPVAFAVRKLSTDDVATIVSLITKAVGSEAGTSPPEPADG